MYIELNCGLINILSPAHTVDSGDVSGVIKGTTNLSIANRTTTTLDIISDSGSDVTVPQSTTSLAGLQTSSDKTKLDSITEGATVNSSDAFLLNRGNHTGTQTASTVSDFVAASRSASVLNSIAGGSTSIAPSQNAVSTALADKVDKVSGKGLSTEDYTSGDKSKLAGIANGATANSTDAILLARDNHTGTQLSSTISDFSSAADARVAFGITGKENTITGGTTAQYWRGDKTWQTFPTIPAAQVNSDWNASSGIAQILNKPTIPSVSGLRKCETFLGTTDSSGNYSITFTNSYASAPDIQPQIIGGNFNQFIRVVSVSTTGAVVQAGQRNTVNLLSTELLLGTTVNLVGASVSVLVTPRS